MIITRIQIKKGSAKIAICFVAFFILLNKVQAQKTLSTNAKFTYVSSDIHDGETKNITYNTPVAFESAFTKTNGPFASYTQTWKEKYKKTDSVQTQFLNSAPVLNMRTLSYSHRNQNFKSSVKGVSSLHGQGSDVKVKGEKTKRKNNTRKMRINLITETRLIN